MADFKITNNLVVQGATATVNGVEVTTNTAIQTLTGKTIDADLNTISNIENADIKSGAAIDASKIADGSVSNAEFQRLDGVTSNIQTQLDAKVDDSEKGAPNGVATLDGSGKVPVSQLPNAIMEYQGTYNASTNTPTLADGVGSIGDVYRVTVAGTQDLGSGNITFNVGDYAILNSSLVWEKADTTDSVTSVNGQTGIVVLDTDDINEGATNLYYTQARFDSAFAAKSTTDLAEGSNLYFTDERAQDAVGTILVDSASIDFTYNDGTPSITASVLPAGVDHDQLMNFVANEHVDHSTVQIATAAGTSGLTGGGDITTTRNLSVDINGTTAETSADNADKLLIYDNSASALKSMTRANFLSGIPTASVGDISETSFSLANNQASPANVTGLAFSNATARSFRVHASVIIDATTDLFEVYELSGIQKGSSWDMSQTSTGDDAGLTFSITNAGQIQYTSTNNAGFVSGTLKFRAITTTV